MWLLRPIKSYFIFISFTEHGHVYVVSVSCSLHTYGRTTSNLQTDCLVVPHRAEDAIYMVVMYHHYIYIQLHQPGGFVYMYEVVSVCVGREKKKERKKDMTVFRVSG